MRGSRNHDRALERILEDEADLSPIGPDDQMVTDRVLEAGALIPDVPDWESQSVIDVVGKTVGLLYGPVDQTDTELAAFTPDEFNNVLRDAVLPRDDEVIIG